MRRNPEKLSPKSPYVIIVAIVLAGTVFLTLLSSFQSYRSTVSVLVLAKSDLIASQSGEVLDNLVEISGRLSFYESMLDTRPAMPDIFPGADPDQKKERWNKIFRVEKKDGSTILNVQVVSPDRSESQKLARKSAFALINTASRYYNIRKDVELRIMDEPTTEPVIRNWFGLLLMSITFGYILSYLVNYVIFQLLERMRRFSHPGKTESFSHISLPFGVRLDKVDYPVDFQMPVNQGWEPHLRKKAAAPENLPVGDEAEDITLGKVLDDSESDSVGEIVPPIESVLPMAEMESPEKTENREPTEEEYRQRLNALMRGDL